MPLSNSMSPRGLPAVLVPLVFFALTSVANGDDLHSSPDRSPPSEVRTNEVTITARPLARDQISAFFQGRGLPAPVSEQLASSCVIRVVIRNVSKGATITTSLAQWRARTGTQEYPLRLEGDWQHAWVGNAAVSPSAKIAFRFAMLPTTETLRPGDWLQGLVTVGLPAKRRFALRARWSDNHKTKQAWVRHLRCAP